MFNVERMSTLVKANENCSSIPPTHKLVHFTLPVLSACLYSHYWWPLFDRWHVQVGMWILFNKCVVFERVDIQFYITSRLTIIVLPNFLVNSYLWGHFVTAVAKMVCGSVCIFWEWKQKWFIKGWKDFRSTSAIINTHLNCANSKTLCSFTKHKTNGIHQIRFS